MDDFNHKHYEYRWTKGFGIAILLALVLLVGAVYAQTSPNTPSGYSIDSTTGNLIQNPTMTSGTGWTTSGMTGSYTPDGYIFSYTSSTTEQNINLNAINFGYQNTSAVFATSIMYGFKYRFQCANQIGGVKNLVEAGNDCSDLNGPQDTLHATFTAYKSDNTVDYTATYQLGLKNINDGNLAYNPTWQQLAETYTFSSPRGINLLGSAKLSITGMDAGFWGCNPDCYGPQIKDAYMRLNYSVDPCILNPAFNPSCPGFQNILQGSKSPAFYYSYNIAQSLPHIGGGVILHGYDYGFNWWNYGACYNTFMFWCTDWRSNGGGNINFRISDKNNTTLFQNQWYVAGNNSGGSYSNRHLFTENINSLDMGSIQWWTSDVWNHFGWVGWTRPIWTPDPCFSQPLYSPNCSNFNAEIKRLAAEQKALQDAQLAITVASISTTPTSTVTTTIIDATTTNPTVTVTTETPNSTLPVTNTKTSTAATSTALVGDAMSPTSGASRPGLRLDSQDSTNAALSLIRNNQQREAATANQASQGAIQNAASIATASMRQAESLALDAVTRSQNQQIQTETHTENNLTAARSDASVTLGPTQGSVSVVTQAIQQRNIQSTSMDNEQTASTTAASTSTSAVVQFNAMAVTPVQILREFNPLQSSAVSQTTTASVAAYQPPLQQSPFETQTNTIQNDQQVNIGALQINVLQPQAQVITGQSNNNVPTVIVPVITADIPLTATNFTTDRTNPINEIIDSKQAVSDQEQKSTNTQQVKSNVQDNDAAAGVSIANIARTPVGFNAYMVALTDANFYAPREIYRNQKTVDNVRALRQLASDRLHQEMVDSQYRK
jgi:hypothetical protein